MFLTHVLSWIVKSKNSMVFPHVPLGEIKVVTLNARGFGSNMSFFIRSR